MLARTFCRALYPQDAILKHHCYSEHLRCFSAASSQGEVSFHRRQLLCPPSICSFSSEQGRQIMKDALVAGTAEGSYRLLEQFRTQDEPAYCGLGTLVMALNALDIDPGRVWKGVWRWYHEDMLDCCEPLEVIQEQGIVFEKFCRLASCNGAVVQAHRPDEDGESLDVFRQVTTHLWLLIMSSWTLHSYLTLHDSSFHLIGSRCHCCGRHYNTKIPPLDVAGDTRYCRERIAMPNTENAKRVTCSSLRFPGGMTSERHLKRQRQNWKRNQFLTLKTPCLPFICNFTPWEDLCAKVQEVFAHPSRPILLSCKSRF
mmetsp:Transcript_81071/g.127687  ORF Transcript_81071/g.127687 Transcript_81071/m.127687 type:complete len:314 (+) Transcript_81071:22-963(+)